MAKTWEELGVPARVGEFCVDAGTDLRRYGQGTRESLEGVCTELFNGECEMYRRFGLVRVESFAFVHQEKATQRIAVTRSQFDSSLGAYGFFQRRVVGDGVGTLAVEPISAPTMAVLGAGVAYVWRGREVLELVYLSEVDPPDIIEKNAVAPLSDLTKALGARSHERDEKPVVLGILMEGAGLEVAFLSVRVDDGEFLGRPQAQKHIGAVVTFEGERLAVMVVEQRDARAGRELLGELTHNRLTEKWDSSRILARRYTREGHEPEDWSLSLGGRFVVAAGPAGEGQPVAEAKRERLVAMLRRAYGESRSP